MPLLVCVALMEQFYFTVFNLLWLQLSRWNKKSDMNFMFTNILKGVKENSPFASFPSKTYETVQLLCVCWSTCQQHRALHQLLMQGFYAMIEGALKLLGPAMHSCGQLNCPFPNLRRTNSEAPYRALLGTSWPLSEALRRMHRAPPLVHQTELHFSKMSDALRLTSSGSLLNEGKKHGEQVERRKGIWKTHKSPG